jgi:hypothetical protein
MSGEGSDRDRDEVYGHCFAACVSRGQQEQTCPFPRYRARKRHTQPYNARVEGLLAVSPTGLTIGVGTARQESNAWQKRVGRRQDTRGCGVLSEAALWPEPLCCEWD